MLFYKTIAEKKAAREETGGSIYANLGLRLTASFIDLIISIIVLVPLIMFIIRILHRDKEPYEQLLASINAARPQTSQDLLQVIFIDNHNIVQMFLFDNLLQLFLMAIMIFACWKYKAATPGKMMVGISIVDVKTLSTPSTKQYIIRIIGYIISSVPIGLGFLWMAFNKKRQGWHDLMAGTTVIIDKNLKNKKD